MAVVDHDTRRTAAVGQSQQSLIHFQSRSDRACGVRAGNDAAPSIHKQGVHPDLGAQAAAKHGIEFRRRIEHDADAAAKFLNLAAARLGWSARSTHRALKVARTIADLAGASSTQVTHVAEAMQYRRALRA